MTTPPAAAPPALPLGEAEAASIGLSNALRGVAAHVAGALPQHGELSWEAWRERAEEAVYQGVDAMEADGKLPRGVAREALVRCALAEIGGYGCLEALLAEDAVQEILVNGPTHVYVDRGRGMERSPAAFGDEVVLANVAARLVGEAGGALDATYPVADVRAKDGVRIRAVAPPVAVSGTVLALRKPPRHFPSLDELAAQGVLSSGMADFLEGCVRGRKNILVAGGRGGGGTAVLAALASCAGPGERVITIEESAELRLPLDHVVALQARPPGPDGRPGHSVGDLLGTALRLRPDRVVVGDVTEDSALGVLRAMTGACAGGVLAWIGGDDPRDAVSRLEMLCFMAGRDLPARVIREYIAGAVDVIVVVGDQADGTRLVKHVTCVNGIDVDLLALEDVFVHQPDQAGAGEGAGRFVPTGFVPRFFEDLLRRGIVANRDIFRE